MILLIISAVVLIGCIGLFVWVINTPAHANEEGDDIYW